MGVRTLLVLIVIITFNCPCILSLQFNVFNVTGNVYQFSSAENTGENGDPLGTVACTEAGGAALTGPVTYSILESISVPFQLNSNTGVLSLRNGQVLDYEQSEVYSFNVSCSYVSDPGTSAMAAVRFSILPVNEFSPDLSDSSLTVTISELTPAGTILVSRDSSGLRQYSVSDADSGTDGEIRFLSGDNNPPGFELNEISGNLTLTQSLDIGSGSVGLLRITYTILVCDGDRPRSECNSLDVSILVRSANDNPPLFEQDVYNISIPESTPVGSSLITVVCTDADRHGVGEFSGITVEPADAPVYIPNEKNGTIILRENLDFESIESTLTLTLVCRDTGTGEANATLIITITPVNDNTPQFEQDIYNFSIPETTPVGSSLITVVCTDDDQQVREFSGITVEPADAPVYIPNEKNGTVILRENLDFESIESTLIFTLVCRGTGAGEVNATLIIAITPVNDNFPLFGQDKYTIRVSESTPVGSSLITVVCTDDDQLVGEFSGITVEPADAPVYIPDEKNGTIILRESILVPEVTVTLVCQDSGPNVLRDNATLVITLTMLETLSLTEILLIGVLGGGGLLLSVITSVLVCILCTRANRKKTKVDTDDIITNDAMNLQECKEVDSPAFDGDQGTEHSESTLHYQDENKSPKQTEPAPTQQVSAKDSQDKPSTEVQNIHYASVNIQEDGHATSVDSAHTNASVQLQKRTSSSSLNEPTSESVNMTELKEETEPMEVIEKQSSTEIKNVNYVIVNPTSAEKFNHGGDDGTGCECHTAVPKQLKGPNETSSEMQLGSGSNDDCAVHTNMTNSEPPSAESGVELRQSADGDSRHSTSADTLPP